MGATLDAAGAARLRRAGLRPISPGTGAALLDLACRSDTAHVVAANLAPQASPAPARGDDRERTPSVRDAIGGAGRCAAGPGTRSAGRCSR
ncbi:hypothetical protein [Thermocatellispora tengchongensis]|uniref:hypothetical protein n=1 Tax=Thermocatellispora tengchongensis TaxID=1073253 RepID=UPI003629ECED